MILTLSLSKALLCSALQCWPALIGPSTPIGEFQLVQRYTLARGYGGDVLQFHETENSVVAIHRVWLGRESEHRRERLASSDPKDRVISKGCINVDEAVYDKLVAEFPNAILRITR